MDFDPLIRAEYPLEVQRRDSLNVVYVLKEAAWKIPMQLIVFYLRRRLTEQIKILVAGIWNDAHVVEILKSLAVQLD